eukprot:g15592.t1
MQECQTRRSCEATAFLHSCWPLFGTPKGCITLLHNRVSDIKMRLSLSEVDGFSGDQLPLTQFVICGGQSAGKSRLLEALAGASFNFVCGTLGSRRPTVVDFRSDKSLEN